MRRCLRTIEMSSTLPVLAGAHPGTGRIKALILIDMKALIGSFQTPGVGDQSFEIDTSLFDPSTNTFVDEYPLQISLADISPATDAQLQALITAAIISRAAGLSYTITAADFIWSTVPPTGPNSYQTIVSQTGTAAPAVSGGFTPTSTYASGVTFTWARTGAGVYTITASSAVFTVGKTGVFVAPLQNLNASVRAVVTSSTVITVTTAVQAVAVLGLLGLSATNTDALLSGTMIYVQTYA